MKNIDSKEINKIIGKNIRKYRNARGYSQENMATMLNISQSSFAKIENCKTKISIDRLHEISVVLEVSLISLFTKRIWENAREEGVFKFLEEMCENGRKQIECQYKVRKNLNEDLQQEIVRIKEQFTGKMGRGKTS